MSEINTSNNQPDTETALYVGAAGAAVVGLLPYVNVFIIPSYTFGAILAVWFAVARSGQRLTTKQGAKLGFYSSLLGTTAGVVVVDALWQIFNYQLWQEQNAQLLLALFRTFASAETIDAMQTAFAQNAAKPFAWYMVIVQIIANLILAGTIGVLAGLLTAKVMESKDERTRAI